ncbi:MAG: hypothetical protein IH621_01420 [Krumholzibacteria bacterium]|nr:hypothetical protein [Candidatus Krumholzibacteria bacterium]
MALDRDMAEFKRLFGNDRVLGESLLPIMKQENEFKLWVNAEPRYRNQTVEATLGLFVDTLVLAGRRFSEAPDIARAVLFRGVLAWYAAHFRRFRAAEILYYSGYGMAGASLLRDVRDWAFGIAALQSHVLTWHEIHGGPMGACVAPTAKEEKARHRSVMDSARKVKQWALGKDSGLANYEDLQKWYRYSNFETHGALVTTSVEFGAWLDGTGKLPLAPTKDPHFLRLYINRSIEMSHLVLRLLPVLQVVKSFGDEWNEKWHCLDTLFSLEWREAGGGAKYIPVFGQMVQKKFAFPPETTRLDFQVLPDSGPPVLDY